jgi:signal transduction histidine kinase
MRRLDASTERRLADGFARALRRPGMRETLGSALFAALMLFGAVLLALRAPSARELDLPLALAFTVALAVLARVEFSAGAGYAVATQAVFVPMLLLLPTPFVPLLVCAGWLLGNLPDVLTRRLHPDRLLLVPANCWFAIGPAVILTAAGAQTPDWSDWPWYLLALASQFALDLVATVAREWAGRGIPPRLQARLVGWIQAVDAMLAPLGLLAAFAAQSWHYAVLLLAPAAGLLVFFSRERSGRLQSALALADAARTREQLIARASHDLVTPVAVVGGLLDRFDPEMAPARRDEALAAMRREMTKLRHRVREFSDYARLQSERDLRMQPRQVEVLPVARAVAAAFPASAVAVDGVPPALRVYVDPERLQQMLMSLVGDAVDRTSASQVEARAADVPLGLHLARELARAAGGEIHAGSDELELALPSAG